jgi:transposase-like protein
MTKTSESKWRALIAEQEKSSLTVREFAEIRGITPTTLYWWRSELKRRSGRLVAVQVVDHDTVAESRGTDHPELELDVGNSMTLRIPSGFDEVDLRRVLMALRC